MTTPAKPGRATGPKTPTGKQKSARNALKHGLLGKYLIIDGERRADYNQLLDGLMASHRPANVAESLLVEKMAIALWKQRRLTRVETADINNRLQQQRQQRTSGSAYTRQLQGDADTDAYAFPVNAERLLKYMALLENQYYRALDTLLELQETRQKIIAMEVVTEQGSQAQVAEDD